MIVIIEKKVVAGEEIIWVPVFLSFSKDREDNVYFMPGELTEDLRIQKYVVESDEELAELKEDWIKSVTIKEGEPENAGN